MSNQNYREIKQWLYQKIRKEIYDEIRRNEEDIIKVEINEEIQMALEKEAKAELKVSLKDEIKEQLRQELEEELREEVFEKIYCEVEDDAIEKATKYDWHYRKSKDREMAIEELKNDQEIINSAIQGVKNNIIKDESKMQKIIDEIKCELTADILNAFKQDEEES